MADDRKIGEGHFEAWIREGFKELAQALEAFPGHIHHVEEPGLYGNPTPLIVTDQMGASHFDQQLREASQRSGPDQSKDLER